MTYGEAALAKCDTPFDIYSYVMGVLGGRDFDVLTPGERIFALSSRLIGEVANGGFDQYFFNGGDAYAHETARAFETIGASRAAGLVRRAIEVIQLPERLPDDFDYYDIATEELQQQLGELDQQLYDSSIEEEEVYPRLVDYLREHTDEFS